MEESIKNSEYYSRALNMAEVTAQFLQRWVDYFYLKNPNVRIGEKEVYKQKFKSIEEPDQFISALTEEICTALENNKWTSEYFAYKHFTFSIFGGRDEESSTILTKALEKVGLSREKLGLNRPENCDLHVCVRMPEYSYGIAIDLINYNKKSDNTYEMTRIFVDEIPVSKFLARLYIKHCPLSTTNIGGKQDASADLDTLLRIFIKKLDNEGKQNLRDSVQTLKERIQDLESSLKRETVDLEKLEDEIEDKIKEKLKTSATEENKKENKDIQIMVKKADQLSENIKYYEKRLAETKQELAKAEKAVENLDKSERKDIVSNQK